MSQFLILPFLFFLVYLISSLYINWMKYCYYYNKSKERMSSLPIGKGNYNNFKNRFKLIKNWEREDEELYLCNENEHFKSSTYTTVSEDIFIFNNNIMLLNLIDYFRARLLIRKKIKELKNKNNKIRSWDEVESEEILNKISNN